MMTPATEIVLKELRANTEYCNEVLPDGSEWNTVYLYNAIPAGMSPHAFAGHLSVLERAGLYRPHGDGCFGDVLALAIAEADADQEDDPPTIFHIRRPLRRARGNQFYRDRSDQGQGTYCGAPETSYDVDSLRDAVPFAGRIPCQACRETELFERLR